MDKLPTSTDLGALSYEDFVPSSEWVSGYSFSRTPGQDSRRTQLRVQLDKYGNLCTSGERPLKGNRWIRFRKEFRIPYNCNASKIRTKFENGILTVTLAKLFTEAEPVHVEKKGKCGVCGLVFGMNMKRRQMLINAAVAAVVMMGVGIYVAYKFRKIAEAFETAGEQLGF